MHKAYETSDLLSICDNLGVAVIAVDNETDRIIFVNEKVVDDLGRQREKIEGFSYFDVFYPEFHRFYLDLASRVKPGSTETDQFYWTERAMWEQVSVSRITISDRDATLLTIANVTDIAKTQYEYKQIAFFDGTTGLPNARQLEEDVNEIADSEEATLVYFEVEHLDDVYDLYGWEAGDALLVYIRDWLFETKLVRTHLYRVDDGFVMLGRLVTKADLVRRAHIIRDRFSKPWVIPLEGTDFTLYCTVKIGIVFGKYVRNEMRSLIMRTMNLPDTDDKGYVIYDEHADMQIKREHRLRNELIADICNEMAGFDVHYHPIVQANTGRWMGVEALCRWDSAHEGAIPPLVFIPEVEQLGLVAEVDAWVRKRAMRLCHDLNLTEKEFYLDVNFSPRQQLDEAFLNKLIADAEETNFPLPHLIIEITESHRMRFDDATISMLEAMKSTGVLLSLDDFGSGYSSIENLMRISASTLKTDKVLIDGLEQDSSRQHLMKTLIDLAHSLDMAIVVEGVETEGQRDILVELGADFIQGYLFSKPLTFEQMKEALYRI